MRRRLMVTDSSTSDPKSPSGSADKSTSGSHIPAPAPPRKSSALRSRPAAEATGYPVRTPPAVTTPAQDEDAIQDSVSGDSSDQRISSRSASSHGLALSDAADHVDSAVAVAAGHSARSGRQQSQTFSSATKDVPDSLAPSSADALTSAVTTSTAVTATAAASVPSVPQQRPTLASVVSDFVAAVLHPMLSPDKGFADPDANPVGGAVLGAKRV